MARWRSAAIERLPELREMIAEARSIMALWIELHLAFGSAYREPKHEDLISRIYSFADWCLIAPRHDDASHDPLTAVIVAFYEHIPQSEPAREDMPRWFTYDHVAANRATFSRYLSESAFNELLSHMRRHADRFIQRPAAEP